MNHLFTHPCNFAILKYFGVGEYVAVYQSSGSIFYYIFERLGFTQPKLGKTKSRVWKANGNNVQSESSRPHSHHNMYTNLYLV
jgi:CRISPR/Cas system type I-B associated protein Csh2 (Cas7 group RAMP superfamily)